MTCIAMMLPHLAVNIPPHIAHRWLLLHSVLLVVVVVLYMLVGHMMVVFQLYISVQMVVVVFVTWVDRYQVVYYDIVVVV